MNARNESAQTGARARQRAALDIRKILLIEDDPFCRDGLAELFESWGYSVDKAGDGHQGLRLAYLRPYDIAVIDIGLPDISGYAVAQELRGLSMRTCPLLVALTARAEPRDRHQALVSGFDVFLTKPASIDALKEVLGA